MIRDERTDEGDQTGAREARKASSYPWSSPGCEPSDIIGRCQNNFECRGGIVESTAGIGSGCSSQTATDDAADMHDLSSPRASRQCRRVCHGAKTTRDPVKPKCTTLKVNTVLSTAGRGGGGRAGADGRGRFDGRVFEMIA